MNNISRRGFLAISALVAAAGTHLGMTRGAHAQTPGRGTTRIEGF